MSGSSQATSPVEDSRTAPPPSVPPPAAPLGSHGSMTSMASVGSLGSTTALAGDVTTSDSHHQLQRRDSQGLLLFILRIWSILIIVNVIIIISLVSLPGRFTYSFPIEHGQ